MNTPNKKVSPSSKIGDTGERGDTGDRGIAGERGPKGDHGQHGEKGLTGLTGPTGAPGTSAPYLRRNQTLAIFGFIVLAFLLLAYRSESNANHIRDGVQRQDNFISEVCQNRIPLAPVTCGLKENK